MTTKSVDNNTAFLIQGLVHERNIQGLSQSYVAEKAGINQGQLSRIESLECDPKIDTIIGIAHALGKNIRLK